ncbi:unnamed protein product [Trichobilharzia szidati]|nr:unnamed protein product [Trichobilharzia szidati]
MQGRPRSNRALSTSSIPAFALFRKLHFELSADRPIHRPVQSLFSTSSGFNNFRGLLNLAGFLLLISTSRMALENILKYGIIMDPFSWIRFLLQAQQKCAVIGLLGCTNVFIIFAWLLERAIVRGLVGGKFAMALIWWNLLCLLAFPTIMILSIDFNPLFSAPVLGVYTIVLLKLYSYADVNRWCRQSTGNNEQEIDIALKNLGKPDFTKDDSFFNTNTITAISKSNHISSFANTVSSSKLKLSETVTTSIHSDNVETISQTVPGISNSEDESTAEDQPVKRKCSPVLEDVSVTIQTEDASIEHDSSNEITNDFKSVELQNEHISGAAEQFVVNRKIKTANFSADSNYVSTKLKSSEYLNNLEAKHKSRVRKLRPSRFSVCEVPDNGNINSDPVELEVNTLVHDETCIKFSRSLYVTYPNNLTLTDIYYFMFAPTLCYELNFPRTLTIRKQFLFKRVFELIFIPQLILCMIQQWILPTLSNSFTPFAESRFSLIVERCLKLAIPNHLIWLMFFYLFFHSLLNVIGEILYFGDRFFYSDWWNAESIPEFWSKWNIPVHRFARRHIYIPLLKMGLSRFHASLVVFFVSAFFHEILVSIPLKMPRFWAFLGMLGQVPYAYIVSRLFSNGGQAGNLAVWLALIIGQPMAILAYFHDYFITHYNVSSL